MRVYANYKNTLMNVNHALTTECTHEHSRIHTMLHCTIASSNLFSLIRHAAILRWHGFFTAKAMSLYFPNNWNMKSSPMYAIACKREQLEDWNQNTAITISMPEVKHAANHFILLHGLLKLLFFEIFIALNLSPVCSCNPLLNCHVTSGFPLIHILSWFEISQVEKKQQCY